MYLETRQQAGFVSVVMGAMTGAIGNLDGTRGQEMKYNRDDLIQKLITHEGLRLDVYQDTLGINTIGIGRNLDDRGITQDELDWMDYPTIEHVFSDGITEVDAMYLAQNDVQIVEEELVRAHPCVEELDAVRQSCTCGHGFQYGRPSSL